MILHVSFGFSMTVLILQRSTFPRICDKLSLGAQSERVSLRSLSWSQDMVFFTERSKMAGISADFMTEITRVPDSRAFADGTQLMSELGNLRKRTMCVSPMGL